MQPAPGISEPESHCVDLGLTQNQRVRRSSDFRSTYAQGHRWVGRTMVLWIRDGEDACCRLGVVASKKVGGAVQRNRAKRRLREVFKQLRCNLTSDVDIILVSRRQVLKAPFAQLLSEFKYLSKKAAIWRRSAENNDG